MQGPNIPAAANHTRSSQDRSLESYGFKLRTWSMVVLAVCLLSYPWVVWGLQSGHDASTHLLYFHAFDQQWRSGEFYPRWLKDVNDGAGSPIFFMQYPLPYYAGIVLQGLTHLPSTTLGESRALGLVFFFAAIFLASSLYFWCLRLSNPHAAALAALAGFLLPYVMCFDFYTRIAIGECLGLACMALALCFSHDLEEKPLRAICGISLAFALLLLSHLFSAIIFTPFFVLYILMKTRVDSAFRSLAKTAGGLIIGAGLASVYVLPMLSHRRFFDVARLMNYPGGNGSFDNQLFPINSFVIGDFPSGWWLLNPLLVLCAASAFAFWLFRRQELKTMTRTRRFLAACGLLVVLVTVLMSLFRTYLPYAHTDSAHISIIIQRSQIFGFAVLTLELGLFLFLGLRDHQGSKLSVALFASSLACFLLMTRWTALLWKNLHVLWSIQFPWRFLGPMSIFVTGLLALSIQDALQLPLQRRIRHLCLIGSGCLGLAVLSAVAWQVPQKFLGRVRSDPVASMDGSFFTYTHTEYYSTDRILSLPWAHRQALAETSVREGSGDVHMQFVSPRHRSLEVDCLDDCRVQLHLLYYPAWQAHDSSNVPLLLTASPETGLIQMSLRPGHHHVELELPADASEHLGVWLSGLSLVAVICLGFKSQYDQRAQWLESRSKNAPGPGMSLDVSVH